MKLIVLWFLKIFGAKSDILKMTVREDDYSNGDVLSDGYDEIIVLKKEYTGESDCIIYTCVRYESYIEWATSLIACFILVIAASIIILSKYV